MNKLGLLSIPLLLASIFIYGPNVEAAACSVKDALGSVTYGVDIPQAGEYKLWARLRPESKTANTIYLEIDGNTCLVVGDDDSLAARTWKWVDYSGKENKKQLLHTFESAGKHTIKVTANESGVGIDRLLLLAASDTCVPDNKKMGDMQPGDNCKSEATVTPVDSNQENSTPTRTADSPMSSGKKTLIVLGIFALTGSLAFIVLKFKLWRRFRRNKPGGTAGPVVIQK